MINFEAAPFKGGISQPRVAELGRVGLARWASRFARGLHGKMSHCQCSGFLLWSGCEASGFAGVL